MGPVVTSVLAYPHDFPQDDLCITAPVRTSGKTNSRKKYSINIEPELRARDLRPETDFCGVPRCVMEIIEPWNLGFVDEPPPNKQDRSNLVSGCGEITGQWEQHANAFPGFTRTQRMKLETTGEAEIEKLRMVHEGLFWVRMDSDRQSGRFSVYASSVPVSPTKCDFPIPALLEVRPCGSLTAGILTHAWGSFEMTTLHTFGFTPEHRGESVPGILITQCVRSGSVCKRQRYALQCFDIEHAADLVRL
ncbi:hypothetical protein J3R82DRAFT_12022 [Butyriboletus roseoflavus]|nr:hypothetical protein J3R82DRAFT_12022 [Butyriboletus roseoflavus]